jgi:hypothetical protein
MHIIESQPSIYHISHTIGNPTNVNAYPFFFGKSKQNVDDWNAQAKRQRILIITKDMHTSLGLPQQIMLQVSIRIIRGFPGAGWDTLATVIALIRSPLKPVLWL